VKYKFNCDAGMFTCKFAEYLSRRAKFTFTQQVRPPNFKAFLSFYIALYLFYVHMGRLFFVGSVLGPGQEVLPDPGIDTLFFVCPKGYNFIIKS